VSASLSTCPFCGVSLADEPPVVERNKDDIDFPLEVLKSVAAELGANNLSERRKVIGMFSDKAPFVGGYPDLRIQSDKKMVARMYDEGVLALLMDSHNCAVDEKAIAIKKAVARLCNSYIDKAVAEQFVDMFVAVLNWEDPAALFSLGKDRLASSPDAVPLLIKQAAEAGNMHAQAFIGETYQDGTFGMPQDNSLALHWCTKAAEQGDPGAQCCLAVLHYDGAGVEQDYSQVLRWYKKAAEQGYAEAQYELGEMYEEGLGVEQDYAEAMQWYLRAAEQGDLVAKNNIGFLYQEGLSVEQDYVEALKWYYESADGGYARAMGNVGVFYENGWGIQVDYAEAAKWYLRGAERDDNYSQFQLGSLYFTGKGVTQNYSESIAWFRKAAENAYDVAQWQMGYMYYEGVGVEQDYSQAEIWFQRALEQDYEEAAEWLEKIRAEKAASNEETGTANVSNAVARVILQGERQGIRFSDYTWRVLDVQGDKALLLTEEIIERRPYNMTFADVTWEKCTLRYYLNNEFYQKFNSSEQAVILATKNTNANNPWFANANGGNNTTDKIFLLSIEQVVRYFGDSGQLKNKNPHSEYWIDDEFNKARVANYRDKACWWWLRSPGLSDLSAAGVGADGRNGVLGLRVDYDEGGVRPALWLNLE
jgi:TPR repeat protein